MSNPSINILVLAAGPTSGEAPGDYPLCLTENAGVSLLERIVQNCADIPGARFTYAFLEAEVRKFHLDNIVELLTPTARIVSVLRGTQGSGCSALLAASTMAANDELLIVSANEVVDMNLQDVVRDFRARQLDAGTLTFASIHPRYSYVRLDAAGEIVEAAQQNPISRNATAGVFWFRSAGQFVEAMKSMIRKDASTNDAFYPAPAFNEMLLMHARIGATPIEASRYQPLKTEQQLAAFEQMQLLGRAA